MVHTDAAVSTRVPFRERFARSCFEAFLKFSFLHSQDSNIGELALCVCVCVCVGGVGLAWMGGRTVALKSMLVPCFMN